MTDRATNGILLAARLALAGCLAPAALARVLNPSGFAMNLAGEGMPFATEAAAALVVIGAAGPVALAIGVLPRATAALLAAHTVVVTAVLHRFWEFGGVFRQAEQATFLMALATVAGLLLYSHAGPGAWSWAGWRQALFGAAAAPQQRKRAAPRGGRALKAA